MKTIFHFPIYFKLAVGGDHAKEMNQTHNWMAPRWNSRDTQQVLAYSDRICKLLDYSAASLLLYCSMAYSKSTGHQMCIKKLSTASVEKRFNGNWLMTIWLIEHKDFPA